MRLFISILFSFMAFYSYCQGAFVSLATEYAKIGKTEDAIRCIQQANSMVSYDSDCETFVQTKIQSALIFETLKLWDSAVDMINEIPQNEHVSTIFADTPILNLTKFFILGDCYYNKGDYVKAYNYYNKIYQADVENTEIKFAATGYSGACLVLMGEYEEALSRLEWAYDNFKAMNSNQEIALNLQTGIVVLNSLASVYLNIAKYLEARSIIAEAETLINQFNLNDTELDFATAVLKSQYAAHTLNKNEAYDIIALLDVKAKNIFGENSLPYVSSLVQIAASLSIVGQYEHAYTYAHTAYKKCIELGYDNTPIMPTCYYNLVNSLINQLKYEEADEYMIEYFNNLMRQEHVSNQIIQQFCMAMINTQFFAGKDKFAETLDLLEDFYAKFNDDNGYMELMLNRQLLLTCNYLLLQKRSVRYLNNIIHYFNKILYPSIIYLPKKTREKVLSFWDVSEMIPNYIDCLDKEGYIEAINYLLNRKSLLLNCEREFEKIFQNKPEFKSLYDDYIQLKEQLYNQKSATSEDARDDIFEQMNFIENILLKNCPEFKELVKSYQISFEMISNELEDEEIFIETSIFQQNYDEYETGEALCLFLIKKGCTKPDIIIIPTQECQALNNIEAKDVFDSEIVKNFLFDKIINEISPVKKIFISPSGFLSQIPFEYTLIDSMTYANERWDIFRLSSAREFLFRKNVYCDFDNAMLYGGFRYDMMGDELIATNSCYNKTGVNASRAVEMENLRYGVNALAGTLKEVETISYDFNNHGHNVTTITGASGTEDAFKVLSEKSPSIIHLATHGFFWSADNAKKHDYIPLMYTSLNSGATGDEQAMLRSGLLFSGANIALKGEPLPNYLDDGILTALELSNMNLGNVDLVVLSACDTGLGKATSEGVFGLQRGFKLAGANSLLMSLWKVDDEATCLLMTEFFKYMTKI